MEELLTTEEAYIKDLEHIINVKNEKEFLVNFLLLELHSSF